MAMMLDRVFQELSGDGVLHIRTSDVESRERLRAIAELLRLFYREVDGTTIVPFESDDLWPFVETMRREMGEGRIREMRGIFVPHREALTPADYFEAEPLDRIFDRIRASWLIDVLAAGNYTSAFQPIVHADRPNVTFGHEALFRGRAEAAATRADEFFEIARRSDLVAYLDMVARDAAIMEAARAGLHGKLFLNITPSSFVASADSLGEVTAALAHFQIAHDDVVFELVENEEIGDSAQVAAVVERYRAAGFSIALDDLGSGYASMMMLNVVRPEYVKMDKSLIRDVELDPYKSLIARKLVETSHELHASVIAEGIESAAEFAWCQCNGVDLVQGFYIARPSIAYVSPSQQRA